MSDAELKELVATTHRTLGRLAELAERADQRRQEEDERRRQEAARQLQEDERRREESDRRWRKLREEWQEELRASRAEHDRMMRSLNREVARMQQKFGDYSESLAAPALTEVMRDRFHMTEIARRVQGIRNGKAIEFDMLGHANDRVNEVYIAEIKTKLRQDGIDQILEHLRLFPEFFPHHRDKERYGILAAIEAPSDMQRQVLKKGIYLMLVSEDACELHEPEGFQPRDVAAA